MDSKYIFIDEKNRPRLEDVDGVRFACYLADGSFFAAIDADREVPEILARVPAIEGAALYEDGPRCIRWNVMAEGELSFLAVVDGFPGAAAVDVCSSVIEASRLASGAIVIRLTDAKVGAEQVWKDAQYLAALPALYEGTMSHVSAIHRWVDARVPASV